MQIAQKIFELKSKLAQSMQVSIWLMWWLVLHGNPISQGKKSVVTAQNFSNHFSSQTKSYSITTCKSTSTFSYLLLPARLQHTQKRPVFVLAGPTSLSCAWAIPQELGNWSCSQNLWMSSGIAFWSDSQMTISGSNLESNLNSTDFVKV